MGFTKNWSEASEKIFQNQRVPAKFECGILCETRTIINSTFHVADQSSLHEVPSLLRKLHEYRWIFHSGIRIVSGSGIATNREHVLCDCHPGWSECRRTPHESHIG